MIYYTYAYLREDKTPYYIGKGKGNRAYRRRNKGIKPPKDKSRIIILKNNLTEEEAFRHEIYMIAVFGRKDLGTGILHNKTDGGEGVSGAKLPKTEEHKNKIANSQKGKTHLEESKRKIGEAHKGKTISKEHINKIIEANIKYNYKIHSIKESKIYETNNLNAFCKENSLTYGALFETITEKRKQHKGFVLVTKVKIQN
jgi:hypothetical protein